jgi:predicted MFS family arabinose efflux permease
MPGRRAWPVLDAPGEVAAASAALGSADAAGTARATVALRATRLLFASLGLIAGVWGAHVPSLKAHYGLDEGGLALALLAAGVGAVGALFVAGRVIAQVGTRRAAVATGLVMALALGVVMLWPSLAWLLLANAVFGMAMSVHDMAINVEGTALEQRLKRAVMGSLHGMFSLGAMAGALLVSGLLRWEWSVNAQFAAVAAALGLVALAVGPRLLDAHPAETGSGGAARFVWPRGLLLLIGLLIFAGMTAEGIMYDWCVLYLKQELGLPQDRAALGYAAFAGAMAAARFGGDWLRAHWPDEVLLRRSALLATGAMALTLLSRDPLLSMFGFALTGAGLAPVVPLLYTAASRVPGSSSAAAIAAASSIGYAGFLIGPPAMGAIAQGVSLSAAMWVVVAASAVLTLGAWQGLGRGPRGG